MLLEALFTWRPNSGSHSRCWREGSLTGRRPLGVAYRQARCSSRAPTGHGRAWLLRRQVRTTRWVPHRSQPFQNRLATSRPQNRYRVAEMQWRLGNQGRPGYAISRCIYGHRSRCGFRASASFPPFCGQFACDDATGRLRRSLATHVWKIASTLGAVASRIVVTSPLSPDSIDGLEYAKPRTSPIENGALDGPEHVQGEKRNEEMVRDIVHSSHGLVQFPVRSHR